MKAGLKISLSLLLGLLSLQGHAYDQYEEDQTMFTHTKKHNEQKQGEKSISAKNLANTDFKERAGIEGAVDELAGSAKDPYAASLPMIMSAELGDKERYSHSARKMIGLLADLDSTPANFAEWMRGQSFKAWMWGRVLLAADSINDVEGVALAKTKLSALLTEETDDFAFATWAWGYRAALDQTEYKLSKETMLQQAKKLSNIYKSSKKHGDLSNALWAWVMNIQAAAKAGDKVAYGRIKAELKEVAGASTVAGALETGLLRTKESNDYPAWALGIVFYAAAMMGDAALFDELENAVKTSIRGADQAAAKAEHAFAVLDQQLAVLTEKEMGARPGPKRGF